MPILSLFYGIIVRMYMEVGGKHNMPHIHAEYAGKKIVMSLDGEILQGEFPSKQLQLLKAWMIFIMKICRQTGNCSPVVNPFSESIR